MVNRVNCNYIRFLVDTMAMYILCIFDNLTNPYPNCQNTTSISNQYAKYPHTLQVFSTNILTVHTLYMYFQQIS